MKGEIIGTILLCLVCVMLGAVFSFNHSPVTLNRCKVWFEFLDTDARPIVEFMNLTDRNPVGIMRFGEVRKLKGIKATLEGSSK